MKQDDMFKKIIISFFLLIFSYGVYAMSAKPCLFSGMTGVVNYEGKPAANVRLLRKIEEKDIDETITDENGYFEFKVVYQKKSLFDFLPMEFVVQQIITAIKDGKEYPMWVGVKRKPEENAESRGKPLVVSCELTLGEENYIEVSSGLYFTLCTWDVEADPKIDFGTGFDESGEKS
jgi:hypothetical protein